MEIFTDFAKKFVAKRIFEYAKKVWETMTTPARKIQVVLHTAFFLAWAGLLTWNIYDMQSELREVFSPNFEALVESWKQNQIFGIAPRSTTGNLPPNFSKESWGYNWPGTKTGCFCPKQQDPYFQQVMNQDLTEDKCGFFTLGASCRDVQNVPARKLKVWDQGEETDILKGKNTSILHMMYMTNPNGTCKTGSKQCGEDQSPINSLCVPSHFPDCPITDISTTQRPGYTRIQTENSVYYINRKPDNTPFTIASVAEGKACLSSRITSTTPGRVPYVLLSTPTRGCHPNPDTVYLGSIGEEDFFQLNEMSKKDLPQYKTDNKYAIRRYMSRPFVWGYNCTMYRPELRNLNPKVIELSTKMNWFKLCFAPSLFLIFLGVYRTMCLQKLEPESIYYYLGIWIARMVSINDLWRYSDTARLLGLSLSQIINLNCTNPAGRRALEDLHHLFLTDIVSPSSTAFDWVNNLWFFHLLYCSIDILITYVINPR